MDAVKLGWALHISGRMIHVNESVRGKKCNCICPDCGGAVIARQGEINTWCFSHAGNANCSGEGVLHRVAKQIIEDCASNDNVIALPSLKGNVCATDYRGRLIEEDWLVAGEFACLQFAKQEVSIRSDLRADILATIGGKNVAIEICVTNKKSEYDIQKYAAEDLTCLEIYLFELSWNSSYQEIKEALFHSASRAWIYHSSKKHLIEEANTRLQQRITEIKLTDHSLIVNFANTVLSNPNFYLDHLNWPTVSGDFRPKNVGDNSRYVASRIPRVTKFLSSVVSDDGIIKASGLVNDKTVVLIYFTSKHTFKASSFDRDPALIVLVEIDNTSKIIPSMCKLQWINIQPWIHKLEREAQSNYLIAKKRSDENRQNFDKFREGFKGQTDQEKIKFLAAKIGFPAPSYVGKISPHWNTSWVIWKALVWYYSIEKRRGYRVNSEFVAEWHWLAELLDWPSDPQSTELRSKNVWYWFKELSFQNVMLYDGGLNYFVVDTLPSDITPWSKPLIKHPNL
jgi:hypothetical protein